MIKHRTYRTVSGDCKRIYILAYREEEILISGGRLMIRVRGDGLRLRSMTPSDLVITGTISAVELE